jgi:hypothetical protein
MSALSDKFLAKKDIDTAVKDATEKRCVLNIHPANLIIQILPLVYQALFNLRNYLQSPLNVKLRPLSHCHSFWLFGTDLYLDKQLRAWRKEMLW